MLANTTIVQARAVVYHAWLEWLKAFLAVSGWQAGWPRTRRRERSNFAIFPDFTPFLSV